MVNNLLTIYMYPSYYCAPCYVGLVGDLYIWGICDAPTEWVSQEWQKPTLS